jgi:hypothetical protein
MTTLALLSVALIKLGGEPSDLLATLAKDRGVAAIAVLPEPEKIAEFEVDSSNVNALSRAMRARAGWVMVPGERPHFHSNKLPIRLFEELRQEWRRKPVPPEMTLAGENFKADGSSVRIKTEGAKGVKLSTLALQPWADKWHVHWIYQDLNFYGAVESMNEGDFAWAVGKAAGARMRRHQSGFYFELDAEQIRQRALNTFRPYATEEAFKDEKREAFKQQELWKRRLIVKVLEAIKTEQLAKALETPESKVEVYDNSAIAQFVRDRAKQLVARYEELKANPPDEKMFGDFDWSGVNLNGKTGFEFTAKFEAKGLIEYKNAKTGAVYMLRI